MNSNGVLMMTADKSAPPRKSMWGWGIAIVYGLFALGTLGVVAFTMTQKIELVSPDYYAKEVAYERQIERIRQADAIEQQVACELSRDGRIIEVRLPAAMSDARGTVTFYRPSSSAMDREVPLAPDASGVQRIPTDRLAAGFWRVRLLWKSQGREYYREFTLQLLRQEAK
ncbi:MAG TPA: FixH family protein [Blastocatellia bacterium]|nr:FixH family protein [Blastocatellia bacterium]